MTEHTGLPVSGYRPQSTAAVDLVNNNKRIEEATLRVLDALKLLPGIDQRWLQTGRTEIEKGWMAVNRAVFKPDRVKLSEDARPAPADVISMVKGTP